MGVVLAAALLLLGVPLEGLGVGQLAPVAVHRQQRRTVLRHLTQRERAGDARSARIRSRKYFLQTWICKTQITDPDPIFIFF